MAQKNCYVYSPVKHRYALAAQQINVKDPTVLDVGGYKSRETHLTHFFEKLSYTSVNIGPAWYRNDEPHCLFNGENLPFLDNSFQFVVCVDSLEHVDKNRRGCVIDEIIRVSSKRAIIVVPFSEGIKSNEQYFIEYSQQFNVELMPSLVEHLKYGLPTLDEIKDYLKGYNYMLTFASNRHLYWTIQTAMLINTIVFESEAEAINKELYNFAEELFRAVPNMPSSENAYRVIATIDKNPNM